MSPRSILDIAKETINEVVDDDVMSLAAAVSYYTVFSLPPLLVILLAIAGSIYGADAVQEALFGQVSSTAGPDAAAAVRDMIANASTMGDSPWSKVAGIAALVFGASGAFAQLQASLNRAWEVEGKEGRTGIMGILIKRVLSFGMVLTIAFLLLVSLVTSTVISAVGGMILGDSLPVLLELANFVASFSISTLLFGALFVVLPDTRVAWRDVWVGAVFTSVLFGIGKTLIGLYVGRAEPGSAFGAAGSLALVLVWVYYSALIVLVGAEFTQVFARRRGSHVGHTKHGEPSGSLRKKEPEGETTKPLPIRT
jgi:membrane protein